MVDSRIVRSTVGRIRVTIVVGVIVRTSLNLPVAVLVYVVATDFWPGMTAGRIRRSTVCAIRVTVAVVVSVAFVAHTITVGVRHSFVNLTIAVVVYPITYFRGIVMNSSVEVLTVSDIRVTIIIVVAVTGITYSIAIGIWCSFIHLAITVIIETVADLRGAVVDSRIVRSTVACIGIAITVDVRIASVADPVPVKIRETFISPAITVIVETVAGFGSTVVASWIVRSTVSDIRVTIVVGIRVWLRLLTTVRSPNLNYIRGALGRPIFPEVRGHPVSTR